VEIARALIGQPKVLIMDEPTSSLTQVDTENLFAVIERLRRRGVSVIYISHFLEECQRIAHRYTVLRDGESVATGDMASADLPQIIRWMVGREISDIYPRTPHGLGEPVLELRALAGRPKPQASSLTLRAGEILGLAGWSARGARKHCALALAWTASKAASCWCGRRKRLIARPANAWPAAWAS
jgi:ribose transport system ATP-binding protein